MKKFICGFLLGSIFFTSISFAQGIYKNISVVENSVKIVVNGQTISTPNFLVNGTTYVPLRAVTESLGQNVNWDEKTRTVSINENNTQTNKLDQIFKGSTFYTSWTDNGYSEVYTLSQEATNVYKSLSDNEKELYFQARINELRLKVNSYHYYYHIMDNNEKGLATGEWSEINGFKWEDKQ